MHTHRSTYTGAVSARTRDASIVAVMAPAISPPVTKCSRLEAPGTSRRRRSGRCCCSCSLAPVDDGGESTSGFCCLCCAFLSSPSSLRSTKHWTLLRDRLLAADAIAADGQRQGVDTKPAALAPSARRCLLLPLLPPLLLLLLLLLLVVVAPSTRARASETTRSKSSV